MDKTCPAQRTTVTSVETTWPEVVNRGYNVFQVRSGIHLLLVIIVAFFPYEPDCM